MRCEILRNTVIAVTLISFIEAGSCPVWGQEPEETVSSMTAVAASAAAPDPSSETKSIDTAISDLNYKIELIQTQYQQLNGDIDNLRNADSALRKMIAEDRLSLPDPKRLSGLEAGVELVRNDLAQVREEMAVLKAGIDKKQAPESKREKILYSPWLSVIALGFSFVALFAH